MWFTRKHHEYGCPMCGRLPAINALQTEKYHESSILAVLADFGQPHSLMQGLKVMDD